MNENDETKEIKRKGRNITLVVHDGVIGGRCGFGQKFKHIMDNIVNIVREEKINGSDDV